MSTHHFVFDLAEVLPLVTKALEERVTIGPTWWQREEGITPEPALRIIKDQGVYVMNNVVGCTNAPEHITPTPSEDGWCVYAEGYHPEKNEFDDWWIGGDDYCEIFVEGADLQIILKAAKAGYRSLSVTVSPQSITMKVLKSAPKVIA